MPWHGALSVVCDGWTRVGVGVSCFVMVVFCSYCPWVAGWTLEVLFAGTVDLNISKLSENYRFSLKELTI